MTSIGVFVTPDELQCSLCDELNLLPQHDGWFFTHKGRVWIPKLVAIRCNGCKAELRLP